LDLSSLATISTNISTLLSEIGTGNIAAIKTKADTIDWADVTGIVTSEGLIKAKTDTIDWTNVTGIKTKTDTIVWSDVTGIKTKTDTIDWTDITTVKNNVATIVTEVGTGNIAAIKTKTDTITWADITGIVTATGQIKAKTDTIAWTDVTAIKTKTDTIAWTDVTGIKTKTDTIAWGDITAIKTKTDSINWSDISTLTSNVAILITEVGTGNIAAIKTKTDTITWSDVTGIVTSNGQIKAKTDTIDWTTVTGIKTKTDTIAWSDVTGVKAKTDTIVWGDIATIKTNVATLITEVGTGNIAAIKTKTDTIAWTDITGIVTSNGLIKAKTDTINWTDVTGIKTKTDTIAWTDVTGIKTKTDTIAWTDVTSLRTSQEAGWTVGMSDVDRALTGKTYRAKVFLTNYRSQPTNSLTAPKISLYDADRNLVVSQVTMTNISAGIYEYTYSIPSSATQGLWESVVSSEVESGKTIQTNDYWEVAGSPAQVIINDVTDVTIPTIAANVTITNEGLTGYEYAYRWCVVAYASDVCDGSGSNIFYATAAKYINVGQDWNTDLTATVPNAGPYYFKLIVYYGAQSSSATRLFTAVSSNSGQSDPDVDEKKTDQDEKKPVATDASSPSSCNGADFNRDANVNSIDFSVLLAFWQTPWPFRNACVDINGDKAVGSSDFSVLMYEWGTRK
jgi:hypothetical protein